MNEQWIYVSPRGQMVIVHFGLLDDGGADSWPDIFEAVAALAQQNGG